MGAGSSVDTHEKGSKTEHGGVDPIVSLIMPVFYTKEVLTTEELSAATQCWKMIADNSSAHFDAMKASGEVKFDTCLELYSDIFYHRLWDVHPVSRTVFHWSINKQGAFVSRFLSIALDHVSDEAKWQRLFVRLAETHNNLGIKAVECKQCL